MVAMASSSRRTPVMCGCDCDKPYLVHSCWFLTCWSYHRAPPPSPSASSGSPSPEVSGNEAVDVDAAPPSNVRPPGDDRRRAASSSAEDERDAGSSPAACGWSGCECIQFCSARDIIDHVDKEHYRRSGRPYVCRWSGCDRGERAFKARYMFRAHLRMHTGERPYVCSLPGCGKSYSQAENLKTHTRSHSGLKPYACRVCGKTFNNASDRAKHENGTHTRNRMFKCKMPACNKEYTERSSLRKHMRTAHGVENDTHRLPVIRRAESSTSTAAVGQSEQPPSSSDYMPNGAGRVHQAL